MWRGKKEEERRERERGGKCKREKDGVKLARERDGGMGLWKGKETDCELRADGIKLVSRYTVIVLSVFSYIPSKNPNLTMSFWKIVFLYKNSR